MDSNNLNTIESKLANLDSVLDTPDENVDTNSELTPNNEVTDNGLESNSEQPTIEDVDNLPKRKTQYVGRYLQSTTEDIRFRIKVPSIPKSSSKQPATFMPPQPVSKGKLT